jgi:hypothetical protein
MSGEWLSKVDGKGDENTFIQCVASRAHSWKHFKIIKFLIGICFHGFSCDTKREPRKQLEIIILSNQ